MSVTDDLAWAIVEVKRLERVEKWYLRVHQMIGDWYEHRIGTPMIGHEADAITVMEARWRNDRNELARLQDTERESADAAKAESEP